MLVRERAPSFDDVAHQLAARQHGIVTRRQLLDAGVSRGVIERRVHGGTLRKIHRGVYRVGPVVSPLAREMAACLACGDGAVLSHRSAAALWGLVRKGGPKEKVHVSVQGRQPRRPGITVHRRRALGVEETTERSGIPVTTPVRTLLDIVPRLRGRPLERAVAAALALRGIEEADIVAALERHEGRPGTRRLASILRGSGRCFTRSEAEERFLLLIRGARLPQPETNSVVARHEVDFHWPAQGVVAEVDGFVFHSSRHAFERDRRRDAELIAHGRVVLRFTWRQVVNEPLAVVARLSAALSRNATSGVRDGP